MLKPGITAALLIGLAACSAPGPKISARDGWARETGSAATAAAYVTIENKGGADELTGVRSTIGEAMLHESSMEGGVMRMRLIEAGQGLVVPSNGKLGLAPGGAHVMITGLKKPLEAGDRFGLTLQFAKAGPKRVEITVKSATEGVPGH
jgi:copper(I)-binding protein